MAFWLLLGLLFFGVFVPTKEFKGVAKVNAPGIFSAEVERFNGANAFAYEHGAFLGVKRTVAGKDHVLRAKEIQATPQCR